MNIILCLTMIITSTCLLSTSCKSAEKSEETHVLNPVHRTKSEPLRLQTEENNVARNEPEHSSHSQNIPTHLENNGILHTIPLENVEQNPIKPQNKGKGCCNIL